MTTRSIPMLAACLSAWLLFSLHDGRVVDAAAAFGQAGERQASDAGAGRRLTPAEINRIRFMELATHQSRDPEDLLLDRVRVVVPRKVAEEFFRDMEGRPGFEGRDGRQRFMKLSPERKLAEIAYYTSGTPSTASDYMDKVNIRTDPQVMLDFKLHVLPVVVRGCATAKCHGGADAEATGLRLFDDARRGDDSLYTNFLLLDEYELTQKVGADTRKYVMIDRARPGESLLLAWLVPADQTEVRVAHPGKSKLVSVFRDTQQPGYEAIRKWIGALRHPHPDYSVRLRGTAASRPIQD